MSLPQQSSSEKVYWKVLAHNNVHHGFKWKNGLNCLDGPFNSHVNANILLIL